MFASRDEVEGRHMRLGFLRLLPLLGALIHGAASGQAATRATAEQAVRAVVDSFFAATDREQFDTAAALADTGRFAAYVRLQVRNGRATIPMRSPTPEDLMARDSTMPRAAAEWQVKQYRKSTANPFAFLSYEFFGVETPQQLSELTTTQALARWIEAEDPRVARREAIVAANSRVPWPAGMGMMNERLLVLHPRGTSWRIEPRRDLFSPGGMAVGISCGRG